MNNDESEVLVTRPYAVWAWQCPGCGVVSTENTKPDSFLQCARCKAKVLVSEDVREQDIQTPKTPKMGPTFAPTEVENVYANIEAGLDASRKCREAVHNGDRDLADYYGQRAIWFREQAQVSATLALVEQQRIANIIALQKSGSITASRALWGDPYEHYPVNSAIAKALGIWDN